MVANMGFLSLSDTEIADKLKDGQITICVIGIGRIGLPTALSIIETLREDAGEPKKDENVWDDEWDLK